MPMTAVHTSTAYWRSLPEHTLIQQAQARKSGAFEALMRRYNQRLFRTARSIVHNDHDAEEIVQEAYLKAWQALPGYRGDSQLSTWLIRIVVNEALSRNRKHTADIIPLEAAMSTIDEWVNDAFTDHQTAQPEQQLLHNQVRQLIESCIDRLPENYRLVFVLKAVEDMPTDTIAQALDIPEATVRSRFFRARSLLREQLAQHIDLALEEVFSFDGERCDRIVNHVLTRLC